MLTKVILAQKNNFTSIFSKQENVSELESCFHCLHGQGLGDSCVETVTTERVSSWSGLMKAL